MPYGTGQKNPSKISPGIKELELNEHLAQSTNYTAS